MMQILCNQQANKVCDGTCGNPKCLMRPENQPKVSYTCCNCAAKDAELQRLTAALEAARGDAERLDWLESQDTEGVHVEKMHRGSLSGRDLEVIATVFTACPEREYKAHTIREAIDAARHAREQEKVPQHDPGCLWPKCDCEHDCR